MTRASPSNPELGRILAEAGWTEDFLARQINLVASDSGIPMRLDRRSVSHWLAGRRPRPPVPELLTEAFQRHLNRPVTLCDVGLCRCAAVHRLPTTDLPCGHTTAEKSAQLFTKNVLSELTQLAQRDAEHRRMSPSGTYRLAALAIPRWSNVDRLPFSHSLLAPSEGRLEAGQVFTAEQMALVFADTDSALGGGRARSALATYLAADVVPHLRASADSRLRRRLLSAATQLTYLAGFMCFDDEQNGLAQRYYRTTLDLAIENNDPLAYAIALRALSVQARSLGHYRHALELAEAAAATGNDKIEPGRRAFFFGQVGVAAAAVNDRSAALSALNAAERDLDKSSSFSAISPLGRPVDPPMGGYHSAALAHQQAAVRALLGDREGAIEALTESIQCRPAHERRSRAITYARLAELQLHQGHLEEAVISWHAFMDDKIHLSSGRANTALHRMRARLRSHASNRAVAKLLERASR